MKGGMNKMESIRIISESVSFDQTAVVGLFLWFIIMVVIISLVAKAIGYLGSTRKSKKYRQMLSDLFVASKVRKFAEEDKLDLNTESILFNKWQRKERFTENDLSYDTVLEDDLAERLADRLDAEEKKSKKV